MGRRAEEEGEMAKLMHASGPNVARTDLGREQSLESLEELSHGGRGGILGLDRPCGSIFTEPGPREDLALLLIISTPKSIQNHSSHQQPPTKGHLSPTGRQSLEER